MVLDNRKKILEAFETLFAGSARGLVIPKRALERGRSMTKSVQTYGRFGSCSRSLSTQFVELCTDGV